MRKLFRVPRACLVAMPLIAVMLVIGCAHEPVERAKAPALSAVPNVSNSFGPKRINSAVREPSSWLSEDEANSRLRRLSNIHYLLNLGIEKKQTEFVGETTIQFDLKDAAETLTLDFEQGNIQSITNTLTQQKIAFQYKAHFISLPASSLQEGTNSILIKYRRPYSKSGEGFYRFQDPEDKEVYIYTDFEPYHANGLFPCFDQPSLKATYQITVTAPAEWVIVSSARETSKVPTSAGLLTWTFPTTASFSTYLVSIIAGPFQTWSDQAGDIPIRLMARKSLAKYILHDDWLGITKQGLAYYQEYFDFKYPFQKYDQVIVPDFNAGAMENVGAVTFSERYIKRGVPTEIDKENLSVTVLHEMAHMWFGDLVTMKWWNGLWLNESFATFMSLKATSEATRFKTAWESFHLSRKQWGYQEDQFVTTHPIETPVESTDVAESNFDGITYAKGASVLKQINFYLTPEKFQAGVRSYIKSFAYRNTTTDDFFGALSKAAGLDLASWTASWLRTPGLNTLQADFSCKDGKLDRLTLHQASDTDSIKPRAHRVSIALLTMQSGAISSLESLVEKTDTQVEVPRGKPCSDVVFPNFNDEAYVKILLDEKSKGNLPFFLIPADDSDFSAQVFSPLLRSQLWTTYWTSVRDGKTSADEYLMRALKALRSEHDERISDFLLTSMVQKSTVSYFRSALFYLPTDTDRERWRGRLETEFFELFQRKDLSLDLRRSLYDAYVRVVISEPGVHALADEVEKKRNLFGFPLDQDRRWTAIAQLVRAESSQAPGLFAREKKSDTSRAGQQMAIAAEVIVPDAQVKEKWLKRFANDMKLSASDVRAASTWMFPDEQGEIMHAELGRIRSAVNALAKSRDNSFVHNALVGLMPVDGQQATIEFLQTWWNQDHGWLPTIAERAIRVAIQENRIAQRNRLIVNPMPLTNPLKDRP